MPDETTDTAYDPGTTGQQTQQASEPRVLDPHDDPAALPVPNDPANAELERQIADKPDLPPPTDAVEAQAQAFVEHSAEEASKAVHEAHLRTDRTRRYHEEQATRPRPEAPAEERRPSTVEAQTGPRHVDMVTSEEDRLQRHKSMVRDHLRNAEPDMTGGGAIKDDAEDAEARRSKAPT